MHAHDDEVGLDVGSRFDDPVSSVSCDNALFRRTPVARVGWQCRVKPRRRLNSSIDRRSDTAARAYSGPTDLSQQKIYPEEMHRQTFRMCLIASMLLIAWAAASQTAKPPGPLLLQQVRGTLHMITGEGGNIAVDVTDAGVVLVDDMFDRNHADILTQVRSLTSQPLRYVLNTHQHDDHAGGDLKMLPMAEVIAHRNVRANLSHIRQPYYEDTPGTPIGLPRVTFSDELSVHLGASEVRALYFGRGHTNGDAVIYFPELKVIHTGDLFLARATPLPAGRPRGVNIYVDYAQGGSFIEWSRTLDGILRLDFDTVIPGHGPVSTRADVVTFKADLEAMRSRVAALIRSGGSRDAVVAMMEQDYGWRATGCPPSPPTAGCLQFQQIDALIEELRRQAP
jgi:cyclase